MKDGHIQPEERGINNGRAIVCGVVVGTLFSYIIVWCALKGGVVVD